MKTGSPAPAWRRRSRAGFTLVETSAALSIMLALGTALVTMLQQHVSFMSMVRKQSFLTVEAPQIGNLAGRLFGMADHYFVYTSRASAQAGGAPVLTGGGAVRLFFKGPNGETAEHWISAETVGSGGTTSTKRLRCHSRKVDGTERSWILCEGLDDATFRCDEGVLGLTLRGPSGEEITYYGGSR